MELRRPASLPPLIFVIRLEGEFDLADCDRLREAFGIQATARAVVLDFEKTTYIDSSVLRCLIELRRETRERNARLILSNLGPSLKRLFEICEFDRIFEIKTDFRQPRVEQMFAGAEIRTLTIGSYGF